MAGSIDPPGGIMRSRRLTPRAALLAMVVAVALCLGCSDEGTSPEGAECGADGDCAGDICQYGRCRSECDLDRDCSGETVCVVAEDESDLFRVCTVEEETGCVTDGGCPEGLACAPGGICRELCPAAGCGAGRSCEGRVCVEE